jgi:hypothetical protein
MKDFSRLPTCFLKGLTALSLLSADRYQFWVRRLHAMLAIMGDTIISGLTVGTCYKRG